MTISSSIHPALFYNSVLIKLLLWAPGENPPSSFAIPVFTKQKIHITAIQCVIQFDEGDSMRSAYPSLLQTTNLPLGVIPTTANDEAADHNLLI